jgi:hypothetical protein
MQLRAYRLAGERRVEKGVARRLCAGRHGDCAYKRGRGNGRSGLHGVESRPWARKTPAAGRVHEDLSRGVVEGTRHADP